MWDNLTIKGFHFNSAKEYADAKKESETIDYICSRMDINNPEIALKVYIKLLDKQTMNTILGICFLKQLRDTVLASNMIDEEELKTIHSPSFMTEEDSTEFGDETALLNSQSASEYAADVDAGIPEDEDDKPSDTIRRLTRELNDRANKEKQAKNMVDFLKSKIKKIWLLVFGLIIVIGILFAIAVHNNNLVFVDEEIALQDKYSAWEEELTAREEAVKAREKALEEGN